jgi:glycine cleavage system H protein
MYPDNLRYTREHEWVRDEGDRLVVGITAYAQEELGDVVYVELPTPGDTFAAGDEFGTVESVKAVSPLYAPVSGEVLESNEILEAQPELINDDPYTAGWMIRLAPSDPTERDSLLDRQAYEQLVNDLRA